MGDSENRNNRSKTRFSFRQKNIIQDNSDDISDDIDWENQEDIASWNTKRNNMNSKKISDTQDYSYDETQEIIDTDYDTEEDEHYKKRKFFDKDKPRIEFRLIKL